MTITSDILMFCTDVKDESNREITNGQDLIQFNCCIDINAISDCIVVSLPRRNCAEIFQTRKNFIKDFYFEISVYSVIRRNDKKYVDMIGNFKKKKNPIALLFFKFDEYHGNYNVEIIDRIRQRVCYRLMDLLNYYVKTSEIINYSSTFIPFYDIRYENLFKKIEEKRK